MELVGPLAARSPGLRLALALEIEPSSRRTTLLVVTLFCDLISHRQGLTAAEGWRSSRSQVDLPGTSDKLR